MKFYNSKNKNHAVDFRTALWNGLAPEGGLYCPESIPQWGDAEMKDLLQEDRIELATAIIHAYTSDAWTRDSLHAILDSALDFQIPLVQVTDDISILELFHGPTEAFKDVGARFMARSMSYFLKDEKLTILVATSGDTGSAVADGFWNVEGIEVVVLFPKGGVSPYQESQMTTLGNNITAVEVEGTFDDCQDLVKRAFQDRELKEIKNLSSANSINIGRLLPQSLYYYFIAQQFDGDREHCLISVPSGNFGNITSGLYAHLSGLNFGGFVAATNANKTFPEYLISGEFRPRKSVATLSNAMDVGKPSNFERMYDLFDGDLNKMRSLIQSTDVTDEETVSKVRSFHQAHGYLLDPHAAVGCVALDKMPHIEPQHTVVLGTAHPRKFESAVQQALPDYKFEFPSHNKEQHKLTLKNSYPSFKELVASL